MSKERVCANTFALSRRTVVACIAVAPAATFSTLPASHSAERTAEAVKERLSEFASIAGVEHPPIKMDDVGNVQLTDELHDYLVEEGASFDWIFLGDPRAMITALRDRFRVSRVMEIFKEHQAYQNWMNDLPLTWTDEDMEPHYRHLLKLQREMMALPSRNAADFAAKSIVQNFDILTPDEWKNAAIWQEARLLTA